MHLAVQVGGALAILVAYVLAQVGVLNQSARSRSYLVLNLVGGAVLAVDALLGEEWGFFLLEGVWAIVSAWSLARVPDRAARVRRAAPGDPEGVRIILPPWPAPNSRR